MALRRLYATAASAYKRPLPAGKLAAYDEALKVIEADKEAKLARAAAARKAGDTVAAEQLEVKAFLNDPETLWNARNGRSDLSLPVYRYLAERAWRQQPLATLHQRISQMKVVPDVLPEVYPTLDVQIAGIPAAGAYLTPAATLEPPALTLQTFHTDERLYTVMIVDPDSPDPDAHTFTTYLHWLVPNVALSVGKTAITAAEVAAAAAAYVPPHPQKGTPYHRYTVIVAAQSARLEGIEVPERTGFSSRDFVAQHGLDPAGISFFREEWDSTVSKIYKSILKKEEPKFANRPRKEKAVIPAKYIPL